MNKTKLPWTKKEQQALRKLYPRYLMGDISKQEMEKIFGRPWGGISNKAQRIGIETNIEKINWDLCHKMIKKLKI